MWKFKAQKECFPKLDPILNKVIDHKKINRCTAG